MNLKLFLYTSRIIIHELYNKNSIPIGYINILLYTYV